MHGKPYVLPHDLAENMEILQRSLAQSHPHEVKLNQRYRSEKEKDAMKAWLDEQCNGSFRFMPEFGLDFTMGVCVLNAAFFRDSRDAVMFKLAWGGT